MTITLPSASEVAAWYRRAVISEPVAVQPPVVGSNRSAVASAWLGLVA